MANIPSAIIFVNNDLSQSVEDTLKLQLRIDEVMSGTEFDARIAADPNYPDLVHLNGLRIMIIRSFRELDNRSLADIVIFVKAGLAAIEANKFGPPGKTYPVATLTIYQLIMS